MKSVVANMRLAAQADREVIVHGFIVQEIFLDHVSAIAEAKHKFAEPAVSENFHNVPKYRASSDFHHRLWSKLSFFAQPRTKTAAQDDNLHMKSPTCLLILGSITIC